MSEVEKLYENAGVNLGCCKYAKYDYEGEEGTWYYCTKENKECWTYPNGDADCVEKGYPPFTAEKQLDLIIFIINKFGTLTFFDYEKFTREVMAEKLAKLLNSHWQDLSDVLKQQVKGILE